MKRSLEDTECEIHYQYMLLFTLNNGALMNMKLKKKEGEWVHHVVSIT